MNLDNIVNFGFVGMSYTGEGFDVTNILWNSVSEYETLCDERGVPLKEGVTLKVKEGKDIAEYVYKTYGGTAAGTWVKKQTRSVINFGGVLGTTVALNNASMGTYCGDRSVMWAPGLGRFVIKLGSKYYAEATNSTDYFDEEGLPYEDAVYVSDGKIYVAKDGKLTAAAGGAGSVDGIGNATTTSDGLMSAEDKTRLDTLWENGVIVTDEGEDAGSGGSGTGGSGTGSGGAASGSSLTSAQKKVLDNLVSLGIGFVVE